MLAEFVGPRPMSARSESEAGAIAVSRNGREGNHTYIFDGRRFVVKRKGSRRLGEEGGCVVVVERRSGVSSYRVEGAWDLRLGCSGDECISERT